MTAPKFCKKCRNVRKFYGVKYTECVECAKKRGKELRSARSSVWRTERTCECGKNYIPKERHQCWCYHDARCSAWVESARMRSHRSGARYRNKDRSQYRRKCVERREREKMADPIHVRAREMTAKLHWGKGSTQKMDALLRPKIGTTCKWCGNCLTLKNISLDHREPLLRAKLEQYTTEEVKRLNAVENLDFICQKCNKTKSTIPEEKYAKLLKWLKQDKELEMLVLQRLRKSNLMWNK